jgi:hypothetical protein
MTRLFPDTPPDVEQIQLDLLRQAPPWRKLEIVGQMTETVRILAASGLRQRYPDASEDELRRLLADILLGPDLAANVYGQLPEKKSANANPTNGRCLTNH